MRSNPALKIAGLIVAAGKSERMGSPKALLRLNGSTFIDVIAKALIAGGVSTVVATLPDVFSDELHIPSEIQKTFPNAFPERHILGSVQSVLSDPNFYAGALLICPVDMPFVTADLVRNFVQAFESKATIISATHQGKRGHPFLVSSHYFAKIRTLGEKDSLRTLMQMHSHCIIDVESDDPRILVNINTPEDYARCTNPSASIFEAAATEAPGVKLL